MRKNKYTIKSNIFIQNNYNNWRNIYHYGNKDGERMPAMWIYPNNPWKMYWRIDTSSKNDDGFSFDIPSRYRKFNTSIEIKVKVKGNKQVYVSNGTQNVGSGNVNVVAYVNGIVAGTWNKNTVMKLYLGKKFYIKDPWYNRTGYTVSNVSIKGVDKIDVK